MTKALKADIEILKHALRIAAAGTDGDAWYAEHAGLGDWDAQEKALDEAWRVIKEMEADLV